MASDTPVVNKHEKKMIAFIIAFLLCEIITLIILFPDNFAHYIFICALSMIIFLIIPCGTALACYGFINEKFILEHIEKITDLMIVITLFAGAEMTVIEIINPWIIPMLFGAP
jgi:hypothetical protein